MREVDYYANKSCDYCGEIVGSGNLVKIFDEDVEETLRACEACFTE